MGTLCALSFWVRVPNILLVPFIALWMPTWRARSIVAGLFGVIGILPVLVYQWVFAGSPFESTYGLANTEHYWRLDHFPQNLKFYFTESGATQNWLLLPLVLLLFQWVKHAGKAAWIPLLATVVGLVSSFLYFLGHPIGTSYYTYSPILLSLTLALAGVVRSKGSLKPLLPVSVLMAVAVVILLFRPGPVFGRLAPKGETLPQETLESQARWVADTLSGALYLHHGKPGFKVFFGPEEVQTEIPRFWQNKGYSVYFLEDGLAMSDVRTWLQTQGYRMEPKGMYRGFPIFRLLER